ncbi:cuticle protein 14-like [Tropilaelaps mercedesae]|uniref:Cuticle protein 14-like n=1 Tax=Tropilaelaps mercedesae TaxID=418985 RepID=A0A1V9XM11_9ACAR|nr:cuticle protein 14-like [Tropilaelaps mercedesae]
MAELANADKAEQHNRLLNVKIFIAFAALLAAAQAAVIGHTAISTGSLVSSRAEEGLGNYKFAYNEKHSTDGTFRLEAGNKRGIAGSYGLVDIDGRSRVVNYAFDKLGFRESIKTNEAGTTPAAAAATSIASPEVAAVAKTIATNPVIAHASYTAPVAAVGHGARLGYGAGSGYGYY